MHSVSTLSHHLFSLGNSVGTISSPALADFPKQAWGCHSPSLVPKPSYPIGEGRAECSLSWSPPAQQQMPVSHPFKIKHETSVTALSFSLIQLKTNQYKVLSGAFFYIYCTEKYQFVHH